MATLTDCTISGNSAGIGGGLANYGTADLTDCTFSGNSAALRRRPAEQYGTATLTDCTISGNSAGYGGGGLYNDGTATLTDTIVAGNTDPPAPATSAVPSNVSGSYNLIGTGGSGGLVNGVDGNIVLTSLTGLGLAPLGNYGGPTQTMALLPGSPAIGAGVIADYPGTPPRSPPTSAASPSTHPILTSAPSRPRVPRSSSSTSRESATRASSTAPPA